MEDYPIITIDGTEYYDVTPKMTSNTTPSPYQVIASSKWSSDDFYAGYKAFNGTNSDVNDCWNSKNGEPNGYLIFDFNEKIKVSHFTLTSRNYSDTSTSPKSFTILGSDDNVTYTKIKDYENNTFKPNETKLFSFDKTVNFQYYKLQVNETNGQPYVAIGELNYLLKKNSCYYLIKDDNSNKFYNYDEDNNKLIEVQDISILKNEDTSDSCISDLNKVKDLIDLTLDNITILSNKNVTLMVNGLKNDKELIISNQNLSTVNSETIHNFIFDINKELNGNIKFVISNDNGLTWKSWDGSSWISLTNTAPLDENNKIKQYSKLSDSEKIRWNKLKDEIWISGMETDITNVDYNSILTNKTIRFAFVLYRPSYSDNISLSKTNLLYDKIGSWHKLSEDDIDIAINSNMCTVTPKLQNLTNVKVNILL